MPPDPGNPRDRWNPRMNLQPAIPLQTSIKKSALGPPWASNFEGFSGKEPQGTPRPPKGSHREPKGVPRHSKKGQRQHQGGTTKPTGIPEGATGAPSHSRWRSRRLRADPKWNQRASRPPRYTNTPDEPLQAVTMLCYHNYR